jgi:deoxyribodipyrimidine photo-lyase
MRELVQQERIRPLNDRRTAPGRFVAYWMQASQRAECNHALEYAIERGSELALPVVVFFGVTGKYPEANERHYRFMLEGLAEVRGALEKRGIRFVIRAVSPEKGILDLSREAALVVVDRDYVRHTRAWRSDAARGMKCPLVQVETNVVVPVEEASPKEEYAAATIRPKIMKKLDRFMVPLGKQTPRRDSLGMDIPSLDISDVERTLSRLKIAKFARPVGGPRGGTSEAKKRLRAFVATKLARYAELKNDPNADSLSLMSPYLHFGQISPLFIALEVAKKGGRGSKEYLEELVVRRELSMNFVFYNTRYDSFEGLPEWSRKTLLEHARDRREYVYEHEEFEEARTHDPYWNAAQEEMRITGTMHGYMRMYWGKKILEWSRTPEEAYRIALALNNAHELDGRDANGFAGVAWCFGKHDRPWQRRAVFGMVRYMNANGLRRKFDADAYVERIARLKAAATGVTD